MIMFIVKGWKCGPQTLYYPHEGNAKGYKCIPISKRIIIIYLFYYNYSNNSRGISI